MTEFKMPSLGADMESGTLVEWKLKVGDPVKRGDIIAVVETAKGVWSRSRSLRVASWIDILPTWASASWSGASYHGFRRRI